MTPAKTAGAYLRNIGHGVNTPASNRLCYFTRDPISFYNLSAGQSVIGLYIIYEWGQVNHFKLNFILYCALLEFQCQINIFIICNRFIP